MDYVLAHHGIIGMKWGKRNGPPYPLTAAKQKAVKNRADDEKKADMKRAVKNRRTLSNDEIRTRIERIKLERQLKDITNEELSPGKKFVSDVLSSSGRKVAASLVTGAMLYGVKAAMSRDFNVKEMASYMTPKPKNK